MSHVQAPTPHLKSLYHPQEQLEDRVSEEEVMTRTSCKLIGGAKAVDGEC